MDKSILYLSSDDSVIFRRGRRCQIEREILEKNSLLTFLYVNISPAFGGKSFGVKGEIHYVILAPRHKGYYLDNIENFPVYVYILLPPPEYEAGTDVLFDKCKILAWGKLTDHREKENN